MNPLPRMKKDAIKKIKHLHTAFKESLILRAVVTLGIALLLAEYFYIYGQGVAPEGQLFDLRLAITLTLVEVPLVMFGGVIASVIINESRKHAKEIGEEVGKQLKKVQSNDEEKKENHTKELNDKIFKRLATVSIREGSRNDDYGLYVKKDNSQDDSRFTSIIYTRTDHTAIPLDKLPSTYYIWALRHLEDEEYSDKILKPFFELQDLIKQYNAERNLYRQTVEEQIENTINESFGDCSIYPKTIRNRLDVELFTKNPSQRFDDLIIDRISNHYGIMPRGYPMEHPYIICETITEEQLERFKTILNSIMDSEGFLNTNRVQEILLFKKIEPLLKELGIKFHLLSEELGASGSIIKGKCKWEETNLSSDIH